MTLKKPSLGLETLRHSSWSGSCLNVLAKGNLQFAPLFVATLVGSWPISLGRASRRGSALIPASQARVLSRLTSGRFGWLVSCLVGKPGFIHLCLMNTGGRGRGGGQAAGGAG